MECINKGYLLCLYRVDYFIINRNSQILTSSFIFAIFSALRSLAENSCDSGSPKSVQIRKRNLRPDEVRAE